MFWLHHGGELLKGEGENHQENTPLLFPGPQLTVRLLGWPTEIEPEAARAEAWAATAWARIAQQGDVSSLLHWGAGKGDLQHVLARGLYWHSGLQNRISRRKHSGFQWAKV